MPSQPCDAACGGGGCDSCGEGASCIEGAQGKVSSAMDVIAEAEEETENKTAVANAAKGEVSCL